LNIYFLSTLEIGADALNILRERVKIAGVIGLGAQRNVDQIAGYLHLGAYCEENDIKFYEAMDYSLNNNHDKDMLKDVSIDVLIVAGWQRLVPKWLIDQCRISTIGAHGGPYGITGGRGRSPQNWSLIMGKKEFYISIFKIDEGIDSGDIIDEKKFEISAWDDIKSSYNKVVWLISHMIVDNILEQGIEGGQLTPQDPAPRYFPQRTREDGEIDWNRSSEDIYNFIRALTKPYPGAYSRTGLSELIIWRAKPFSIFSSKKYPAGTIVKKYNDGTFMVSTSDGFIQVDEYTVKGGDDAVIKPGLVLNSSNFKDQMNRIIERHTRKYPLLPLTDDILNLSR